MSDSNKRKRNLNSLKQLGIAVGSLAAFFGLGFLCVHLGGIFETAYLALFLLVLAVAAAYLTGIAYLIQRGIEKSYSKIKTWFE